MEKTNQPLYQQLMEDVRSQIENSLLLPGDKLPTEREFMQKIQCQPDYGFQGPERIKGRGSDYPLSK